MAIRQGTTTFPDLKFAKVVTNVSWFGHRRQETKAGSAGGRGRHRAQGKASYRYPLKCQQSAASALLGHTEQEITRKVYVRKGPDVNPTR